MKPRAIHAVWLGVMVMVVLAGLWLRRVAGAHVVGRAFTPVGGEMCVVQKFNWSGEPYTTSFVYRRPGDDAWSWFYYDHEDTYWSRSQAVLDTNLHVATFYRNGVAALSFDWEKEYYWRGSGLWATGAQQRLPSDDWISRLLSRQ